MYYFINDHLGTPQKIVNNSGQIVWAAAYLPFGEAQVTTESIANHFRFPGQYFDSESGLHYNWHRYYDPETGRYITADPIGLEGGVNLYAYVMGNPVNRADPFGLIITYSGKNPGDTKSMVETLRKNPAFEHIFNHLDSIPQNIIVFNAPHPLNAVHDDLLGERHFDDILIDTLFGVPYTGSEITMDFDKVPSLFLAQYPHIQNARYSEKEMNYIINLTGLLHELVHAYDYATSSGIRNWCMKSTSEKERHAQFYETILLNSFGLPGRKEVLRNQP